mmetsp:Transcript_16702/g.28188  ORF Transcript_16702/g.28188 Transcript_16702/m.28188 type:complete len:138 (-) Transcript_16702:221-634(-)|eukprot:CAMPEP_0198212452 /NCGR_PEP_ID=MMETSP1445-20131203/26129_1 /TAXON_ID=36898 /ORGANISM="Pyramimonas sp., Strain CCMP2087" /LENGTH=137 /DNA_ID=CAMNT_0043886901 /DNA_START=105 /DNA_END=518 /DNA_ORIENTATION=+
MEGLDDLFDSALGLEDTHLKEGHAEGLEAGKELGRREGWEVGMRSGFEIGGEVGFYAGCANVWKHYAEKQPDLFSERVKKGIESLLRLVEAFPLDNAEDESLQEVIEKLRAKFKAVSASLGVQQEYMPSENPSSLEF